MLSWVPASPLPNEYSPTPACRRGRSRAAMADQRAKVLVKEKIADSGVDLLREKYDVELGLDWDEAMLDQRIGEFDALLVRSATQVDAALIGKALNMKVIGRAGVGVDNIDVPAATKRGIIVANAPESNVVAAAEHTMALILSMARNVPQAHSALVGGSWERSKYGGFEVYGKVLGILGFGRIGQLVAARATGFEMEVVAYDPFISAERFKELGVERAESPDEIYGRADIITIHLPNTPETAKYLNSETFAKMRDGVRIVNCARGGLVDYDALVAAIDAGKVAGAALDVFPSEPMTEHPVFERTGVVVTPHLGASTAEAQDRAGVITAEQIDAALSGEMVSNAVNIPRVHSEDMKVLEPFIPLCERLGRLAIYLADYPSIDAIEIEYRGRLADFDTRLLTIAALRGVLQGHTEEDVNFVNAHTLADERGIHIAETKDASSEDFTELVEISIVSGDQRVEVAGTGLGPRNLPRLVRVYGQSFNLEFADHFVFFRYANQPGMIGRVGTVFGQHGVNIDSAAVGAGDNGDGQAVMAVTCQGAVPAKVIDEIVKIDGFVDGRAVNFA
jgi:D-3-phosphoglycerate dehydrogenase